MSIHEVNKMTNFIDDSLPPIVLPFEVCLEIERSLSLERVSAPLDLLPWLIWFDQSMLFWKKNSLFKVEKGFKLFNNISYRVPFINTTYNVNSSKQREKGIILTIRP